MLCRVGSAFGAVFGVKTSLSPPGYAILKSCGRCLMALWQRQEQVLVHPPPEMAPPALAMSWLLAASPRVSARRRLLAARSRQAT